ncbi:MAG: hypothetical protein HFE78_02435 [Clostridiales bacterium]|nr:hypothetical protein [Clostridiales bacterium]
MKTVGSFLLALSLVIMAPQFCVHAQAAEDSAPKSGVVCEGNFAKASCAQMVKTLHTDEKQESLAGERVVPADVEEQDVGVQPAIQNEKQTASDIDSVPMTGEQKEQQTVIEDTDQMEYEVGERENNKNDALSYKAKTAEISALLENSQEKHAHQYVVTGTGQVQCAVCQESAQVSTFMPDPDAVVFACKAGDFFWVPVLVNNTEFVGITLRVDVSDNIELTGASTDGTLFAGYTVTADRNVVLNAGDRKEGNILQNGRLVYLRFTAKEDISVDDTVQIRLSSDDVVCAFGDNEVKNIEGSCYFGTVLYTAQRPLGDVNNDGVIDAEDARLLYRYVKKWAPSYYEQYNAYITLYGDVNSDGVINEEDVERLLCYVNGWEDSFWGDSAVIPD